MFALETPHQKKSFVITVVLHSLLLLFLCFFYLSSPKKEEGGIVINFGNSSSGSGKSKNQRSKQPTARKVTPTRPISKPKTPIKPIVKPVVKTVTKVTPKVITQNQVKAPVVKTTKVVTKPTEQTKPIKKVIPVKKEKPIEKTPDQSTKNTLDSFLKGTSSSKDNSQSDSGEGDDASGNGDKGKTIGSLNSKSYYGSGKGLDGDGNYRLGGRSAVNKERKVPDCNEEGKVVVKIVVNQLGKVIEAYPGVKGSTNTAICLTDPAKQAALATEFNADSNAPSRQIGTIVYTFKVSE